MVWAIISLILTILLQHGMTKLVLLQKLRHILHFSIIMLQLKIRNKTLIAKLSHILKKKKSKEEYRDFLGIKNQVSDSARITCKKSDM